MYNSPFYFAISDSASTASREAAPGVIAKRFGVTGKIVLHGHDADSRSTIYKVV